MRIALLLVLGVLVVTVVGCSGASSAGGERPLIGNRIPKGAGPAKAP
jgi:hypothetical protein